MSTRRMSKSKIGYTNDSVPWYYGWNCAGMGCSMACDGCWAKALAKRTNHCPKCKAFEVHLHEERLCEPANTNKPGIVLCNFTNDWLDATRESAQIARMIAAMVDVPRHTYVTLTKNANSAVSFLCQQGNAGFMYHGLTLRTQAEADAKLGVFMEIPGNLWLSLEPLQGGMNLEWALCNCPWPADAMQTRHLLDCPADRRRPTDQRRWHIEGIICGHDNRRGAPGTDTLDHIRSVVAQCKAAGVNVYVKQIWVKWCEKCESVFKDEFPVPDTCSHMWIDCKVAWKWRLLRASHPDEYECFPSDLKHRDLPWRMPEATI